MKLTIGLKLSVLTCLIVIFVGTAISLYFTFIARRYLFQTFEMQSRAVAGLLAKSLADSIYLLDLRTVRTHLRTVRENPLIERIHVLDIKGIVLSEGTAEDARRGQSTSDPLDRELLTSKSWISRESGKNLEIAGPIVMIDGTLVGYLHASFSLVGLQETIVSITTTGIVITVTFLAIGIFLTVIAARSFSRPLMAIADVAREIGQGKLDRRTVIKRNDEIGALAYAINQMVDAIEKWKSEAELEAERFRKLNQELEQRVQQRTAQLGEINERLTDEIAQHQKSEEFQRRLFELSPNAIIVVDPEGRIVRMNEQTETFFGYGREELIGNPVEILLPESFRKRHVEQRMRFMAEPSVRPMGTGLDLYGRRKDGTEFQVEISLGPMKQPGQTLIIATIQDITERKKIEQAKLQLADIVESSEDAIIGKTVDGIITSWDRGAERLYGYTAEEITGQSIDILAPTDHRPDEISQLLEKVKTGQGFDHYETVRITKNGRPINVSLTISPIRDIKGRITGASTIARDITERKRMEQERADFTAIIVHDLRAPLSNVITLAGMMESDFFGALNEEQKKCVGRIHKNARNLVDLVGDFLDLSKLEAGKIDLSRSPTDLNALILNAIENYLPLAKNKKIRLSCQVEPELPLIEADPKRLDQVVSNLLSNALKFTTDGGTVQVRVGADDGSGIRVQVVDSGTGIAGAEIADLFQKYRQGASGKISRQKGTGLGLVICKMIVEAHRGRIWVESENGRGTTFTFTLPFATGPQEST
jgi:protein-histidine pros-kinase